MLFKYLRAYGPTIVGASLFTIVLGGLSATITSLIGPALQILLAPSAEINLSMTELFGPRLGPVATALSGMESVNGRWFLLTVPGFMVAIAAMKAGFSIAQWFMWERVGEKLSLQLRMELLKKFLYLDPSYRINQPHVPNLPPLAANEDSLASILSTDIRMIREYVVHFYGGMPREGMQVFFLLVTLVMLSPKMFLVFLVGVLPSLGVLNRLGKRLRKRARAALQDFSSTTEWIQQRLLGIETIKHYANEQFEINKMRALNASMHARFLRAASSKAKSSPLLELGAIVAIIVVLYFSLREIGNQESSVAVQLSFFSTLAILSQNAAKMGRYFNSNREGRAAMDRYFGLVNELEQNSKWELAINKQTVSGPLQVKAKGVGVKYVAKDQDALRDFTYDFKAGNIYGLCGASGAGKSTLFSLLAGLIRPSQGELIFNVNDNIGEKLIGYMPQDSRLEQLSIAECIAYPEEKIDPEKVARAVEKVNLTTVVKQFPEGVSTFLGAKGASLSGGQAQRLALARVYYHGRPIVLVDEGTSALDPETEQLIFQLLRELKTKGCLIIMIAHRYAPLTIADEVLLLEHGSLVAHGSLSKIKENSHFRQLFVS